ncbi:MAG: type IV pilus secretin PilQ [Candidatus Aminicenantes bacterium]|nr:type IV pilus secretin PilQ [Candidatus Aminicenantes bacterium]
MTKTNIRLTTLFVGLAIAVAGFSQTGSSPASVQLTILPTRVNARVVLDGVALREGISPAYAAGNEVVLTADLAKTAVFAAAPLIPADEPPLVLAVRLLPAANGWTSLALTLAERVPFRYWTEGTKTVIELIKIQHGGGDYLIAPETKAELDRTARSAQSLAISTDADKGDRFDFSARLGRKAIVNTFALDNPLRLVVDVFDAVLGQAPAVVSVGRHGVEKVRTGQFKDGDPYSIARIVFELREPRMFALAGAANGLNVVFADAVVAVPAPPVPVASTGTFKPADASAKTVSAPPTVTIIPVKNSPPPPVKIEAKAEAPATVITPPVVRAEIKAEVKPVEREIPVTVVAPPEPAKKEDVRAESREEQAEDIPPQVEKAASRTIHDPAEKYSGELISPKFKDADLRDVILWLGGRVGLNVIIDQDVRGRVTVAFEDVPWDQFLDMILKNNKLGRILEGNVLRIAPLNVLAEEEKAQLTLMNAREASGPIITKTYNLSYATAREVFEIIKSKKSQRGDIVIDSRTNALIVSDVQEKIDVIDQIIVTLDAATPQVTIETRIVEATSSFVRNLGIQWGYRAMADPFYGNQTSLQFPNKILSDGALIPKGTVTKGVGGPLGGYAVNLPAASFSTAVGFSLANVLDTFRVDMAISALETEGSGKIISSQRVTAQNNKEAYINQGRQIPVQTTANFTVTTQYVNAGLELRATPQITAEGTIIMTIDIQNNAADFGNLVNGIPPITTQSAKTTVMVPDGGTTVIGGIYRVEDSITKERVPLLHQIPILGNLFKNLAKNRTNRELLIFITPRIQK